MTNQRLNCHFSKKYLGRQFRPYTQGTLLGLRELVSSRFPPVYHESEFTVQDEIRANTSLCRFLVDIFEAVLLKSPFRAEDEVFVFDFCAAVRFSGRGASHIATPSCANALRRGREGPGVCQETGQCERWVKRKPVRTMSVNSVWLVSWDWLVRLVVSRGGHVVHRQGTENPEPEEVDEPIAGQEEERPKKRAKHHVCDDVKTWCYGWSLSETLRRARKLNEDMFCRWPQQIERGQACEQEAARRYRGAHRALRQDGYDVNRAGCRRREGGQ